MFVSWGKSFSSISYLFSPKYYMNYPDIAVWQSSSHQSKPWQTKHIFRGQETSTQQPQTWEVGWNFCTSGITTNLLLELDAFPLTIVYMENLEALGYVYRYFSNTLKEKQYIPVDEQFAENRIFAQYHTDYTPEMKHHIVIELRKPSPKIRVTLATVAPSSETHG